LQAVKKRLAYDKLKISFVALVTEQCWSGISGLLSSQNHKNEYKKNRSFL